MNHNIIDLKAVSRTSSHALRHEPWLYELELDDEGWTPIEALLSALKKDRPEWNELNADHLAEMIATSAKRRHEIDGDRIRALYGHSLEGKLKKIPATPPEVLFHGTNPAVLPQIETTGLLPMARQYVHLSVDEETAREVGRRKCRKPTILRIRTRDAEAAGVHFYEGNGKVWLADAVPPEFIEAN
ncbi:RNA 2'-phosphotransferase [Rubinisphaera margarita]|uniref:RNA 2'-phosphotransferase n=1 Tax=Rubinisphaera margarita TaxID=2909586 RepID=UPI001EE92B8B|nr:RNA 2'-phosphotransferase [Rubinisphaera margarita]MCG6156003.1 RNA 2'-phosphotransferase [Rubinisphaera margarita]